MWSYGKTDRGRCRGNRLEAASKPIEAALGRRWPRCKAERRGDPDENGSLRSDNAADGPFPAQPGGTPGISAPYGVAPPQQPLFRRLHSSSLLVWGRNSRRRGPNRF